MYLQHTLKVFSNISMVAKQDVLKLFLLITLFMYVNKKLPFRVIRRKYTFSYEELMV